jgi:hypothetical protein
MRMGNGFKLDIWRGNSPDLNQTSLEDDRARVCGQVSSPS